MTKIQIASIIASCLLIGLIFTLVRNRKLSEQYSIWWFMVAIALLAFSIFDKLWIVIAQTLGIYYPPAMFILIIIFAGTTLNIHFSLVISKATGDIKTLVQEVGLLKHEVENLRKELAVLRQREITNDQPK